MKDVDFLNDLDSSAELLYKRLSAIKNDRDYCFKEVHNWIVRSIEKYQSINGININEAVAETISTTFEIDYRIILKRVNRIRELKLKTMETKTKRTIRFYTKEELQSITDRLNSGKSLRTISEEISEQYGRNFHGVYCKVKEVKKAIDGGVKLDVIAKRKPIIRMKKRKPINVENPATIGVEIPHGMTFEGSTKKILLCSDHFKVYF